MLDLDQIRINFGPLVSSARTDFQFEDAALANQAGLRKRKHASLPECTLIVTRGEIDGALRQIRVKEQGAVAREVVIEMEGGLLKTTHNVVDSAGDAIAFNNGEYVFVETREGSEERRNDTVCCSAGSGSLRVSSSAGRFEQHDFQMRDIWALEGRVHRELCEARSLLKKELDTTGYPKSKEELVRTSSRLLAGIDYAGFISKHHATSDLLETYFITKILMICNRPDDYNDIPGHWVKGYDRNDSARQVFVPLLLIKLDHDWGKLLSELWGLEIDPNAAAALDAMEYPYRFSNSVLTIEEFSLNYNYLGWV